ncbi:MAG: ABC transporter substrate-binding protein [Proteobacteria bacterium]|nr:ABC transporter substrate-binding protein [Pseudomonadota bacterium]
MGVDLKHLCAMIVLSMLSFVAAASALAYEFRPQWVPQTQFAGYYMAVKKGYYRAEGLDLKIVDGGPGIIALREIASDKVAFGTGWLLSALKEFEKGGRKIVLIGQIMQSNALVLVTRKNSGIDSIGKFSGKKLGVWPGDFQIPPKAFIRMKRLKNIGIVQQGFDIGVFFDGTVDIASAMSYNELMLIRQREKDVHVFDFSDLGMKIPEDGIYTSSTFYRKDPKACESFVKASMRGWGYAFRHKDETAAHLTELANKTPFKTTRAHQKNMLAVMDTLVDTDNVILEKADFETALRILKKSRVSKGRFKYTDFVKGPAVKGL